MKVSTDIGKGPAIIVTGHDLGDLKALLEQTEGKGISIYTHGEMLPAHAYPELSKFEHLKGHYGTAWQNQRSEFDGIDVPVLFTTNCLMPPKDSYKGNVFTSGPVRYPGTVHIDDGDFTPLIDRALSLGGFSEDRAGTVEYTTGFGREAVLSNAEAIVEGVRSGAISHFFLVGGCDGAKPGRSYFREFVEKTPSDSVVLTLACGKFRFMRQVPLQRPGPRGHRRHTQAPGHGAVQRRLWRHQGRPGPCRRVRVRRQRPAAFHGALLVRAEGRLHPADSPVPSPGVLKVLVDNYDIHPISDVDADMDAMLGRD